MLLSYNCRARRATSSRLKRMVCIVSPCDRYTEYYTADIDRGWFWCCDRSFILGDRSSETRKRDRILLKQFLFPLGKAQKLIRDEKNRH
jgi:hypothetical protein